MNKILRFYLIAYFLWLISYTAPAQANPHYNVSWINQIGVSTNGDILTKTSPITNWSTAGAISSNTLQGSTDGWMEFSGQSAAHYIIGLTANNFIDLTSFSNAILVDHGNNSYYTYEGSTVTSYGSWQSGDLFRISREGSVVKYYRNGVVVRSANVNPTLVLKVKASIYSLYKSTPSISTSFDRQLILQGSAIGAAGNEPSGNISLVVSGGASPYAYSWSSGEQTSGISSKARGSYTATVTDAVGRMQERTFSIGYKLNWINQLGVSTNGSILTKTSPVTNWATAGAVSSNLLLANADGWMEFSGSHDAHYIVGFAANNNIDLTSFNNAILVDYIDNTYATYEGATVTSHGSWQTGDVFRISREGNVVKYYRNGAVVRSVTVDPALILKVKTSMYFVNKSTPNINTSFDAQLIVQGSVAGVEGNVESGSISLVVSGGAAPYSYSWSSGEQTSVISNKPAGAYSVTVSDAAGRQQTRAYSIGYKWSWQHQVGASANEGILTKTSPVTTWPTGGAISANTLPANTDGWLEFSGGKDAHYMIGLSVNNIIDNTDFSNAILIDYAANSYTTYEGATATGFGGWQTGDIFRISREGNQIKYYRNGTVVRTVTVNPALVLKIKIAIQYMYRTTPIISTSFDKKIFLLGSVGGVDGSSGSGDISILAGGGTPPYTYSWSSGEQSAAISNKPAGSYTITVSDAVGREQARTYEIGNKLFWMHQVGVSANNGILTKTSSNTSWAAGGGISSNLLPANTDGWMEFTGGNSEHYVIGLATNNIINQSAFNNAIFINYPGNSYTTYEGATATSYGNWQLGDVFRISREGNTVKYYRNGTMFRSVPVNPALVLKVATSIQLPGKTTPLINTSFDRRIFILMSVTGLEGNSGSGNITVNAGGGTPPYAYSWSSGEQTNTISNKPRVRIP